MFKKIFKANTLGWDKELFYKEEFKGERIVSYVRAVVVFALAFLAFAKAGLFSGSFENTKALTFTVYILIFAFFYTSILLVIFKFNIYHPIIKFISSTVDLTLCILSIYVYKLDTYPEYATIYYLGRYGLLFIFITLTLLRYSFWLSIYSGMLVASEYFFLIIQNNFMTNLTFTFKAPDNNIYNSFFHASEGYLKIIYLLIAGVVTGILALNLKKLVGASITKEQERTSLLMQNKIIDTINNENKKYLDNIKEGLLLINKEFLIKGHYSKHLENIFERTGFEGSPFIDLVYPDENESIEKRKILEKFLKLLFKDNLADDDMLKEVNPINNEKIPLVNPQGEKIDKIISASFFKIITNDVINEIMVIFEDRTDIYTAEKELEEERIKRETEIEYISVILKAPQQNLIDFIDETSKVLDNFELRIEELKNPHTLDEMFREVHSLKGYARSMEFKSISQGIHEIENSLSLIRDKNVKITYELKDTLRKKVDLIFTELSSIKNLQEKFKRFSNISLDNVKKRSDQSIDDFIVALKKMTEDISNELLKKINFLSENKIKGNPDFLRDLRNPIIHLVRNAADHGIEDRFERVASGKDEFGFISIKFHKDNTSYIIEISDDGDGINFVQIKKKALEKGLLKESEEVSNNKLLNILFKPGFSTKKEITDLSGRGVGLDVVKETVNKLNGKLSIATEKGKGTKFTIRIPL